MLENIHKILVVDDEELFARAMERHLIMEGFSVDTASDGLAAREKIKASVHNGAPYDLVITDIVMPRMDGISLAEWVQGSCPDISLLLITGFDPTDRLISTLRPDLDYGSHKPLTPEKMMGIITGIDHKRGLNNKQSTNMHYAKHQADTGR